MKKEKIAFITGVTGQDGSFLSEQLLGEGAEVHGLVRRASRFNRGRIDHLRDNEKMHLHYGDLHDITNLRRLIHRVKPTEIYHLAGQSHVGLSFEIPESTFYEVFNSTMSLLEICRDLSCQPKVLLVGSSEVFGDPVEVPQNEASLHRPTNPYGLAKSCLIKMVDVYRSAYDLPVFAIIPYNHESIRRGESFVTRKITKTVARQAMGSSEVLELGNLESKRDWGFAPEYVDGMCLAIGHSKPDNFVLATGHLCSVREFLVSAYETAGLKLVFEGTGLEEVFINQETGKRLVEVNPNFFRPVDSARLVGDFSKAKELLGWSPKIVGLQVAARMTADELDLLKER